MESPRKRKSNITMEQKLQALKNIDEGFSIANTAISLGVTYEMVRCWKANRDKIEDWCLRRKEYELRNRSRKARAANEKLDRAVLAWYNSQRKRGNVICGSMIKAKAQRLYHLMGGGNDFLASSRWLNRWKSRYGIELQSDSGKNQSAFDSSEFTCFSQELLRVVEAERLMPEQVFSCVETGLNYKMLPSKTSVTRIDRSARGLSKNQDRVTVMACGNGSGSLILPLMVIGKYPKPRALKALKLDNLPVLYRNDKNASMNSYLFQEWFNEEFVPRVTKFLEERKLPPKALLIIDDSSSHPPARDLTEAGIKTMFFPPNLTPLMRPMDQSISESLKRHYRFKLIEHLLEVQNDSGNVVWHFKAITLRNVIFWLADSWDKIACRALVKAWRGVWPERNSGKDDEEREELSNAEFLKVLHQIEGCGEVDDEDLEQWIRRDDEATEVLSEQEIISMVMESGLVKEKGEQEAGCSPDSEDCENEDSEDEEEEYSERWFKEEFDADALPVREENSDEQNASPSDWKAKEPAELFDLCHIEETQDNDEESSCKRTKREHDAGEPLSGQGTISTAMETGVAEGNNEKDNERSSGDKAAVAAAEAKEAAELLINFFEKQPYTPEEGLMWLHMFKEKAASLTL